MNDFLPAKLRDSVHRGSDGRIVIDSLEAYLVQVYFPFGCQHMDIFHLESGAWISSIWIKMDKKTGRIKEH